MTTIRQVVASSPWTWKQVGDPKQPDRRLYWYGIMVGDVMWLAPGEYIVSHVGACKSRRQDTFHQHPGTYDLAEAEELAKTCVKCGDSPCEALSEPTDEVTAALSGIIQWKPEHNRSGFEFGKWHGIEVARVSRIGKDNDRFICEHKMKCARASNPFNQWEPCNRDCKTIEEARETAEICPRCGDTPCSAYSEPTDEVQP